MKTLDQFDFGAAEGVHAPKIAELARCDWITRGENVLFAGPIGTGKTQRRRVSFSRAADLVRSLIEARDAKELERTMRRLEDYSRCCRRFNARAAASSAFARGSCAALPAVPRDRLRSR